MRRTFLSFALIACGALGCLPFLAKAQDVDTATVPETTTPAEITITTTTDNSTQAVVSDPFAGVEAKDVFLGDNTLRVSDPVNGDLFAAGQTITVDGNVANDVIVAGQTITINGIIYGDVRAAGGTIIINGPVMGNVTVFGGSVIINASAEVKGNVLAYGGDLTISGNLEGNLNGGLGILDVFEGSVIGGDVTVETGNFSTEKGALIQGDVTFTAPEEGNNIVPGTVLGSVDYTLDASETAAPVKIDGVDHNYTGIDSGDFKLRPGKWGLANFVGFLIKIVIWLLVGLLLWYVTPKFLKDVESYVKKTPWPALGWGALWFFVLPIIGTVIALTLIGIPVAIVFFVAYAIGIMLAKLMTAYILGKLMLKTKKGQEMYAFLFGILILAVAIALPYGVGGLISFLATLFGFGGILVILYRRWQARKDKKKKAKK